MPPVITGASPGWQVCAACRRALPNQHGIVSPPQAGGTHFLKAEEQDTESQGQGAAAAGFSITPQQQELPQQTPVPAPVTAQEAEQ